MKFYLRLALIAVFALVAGGAAAVFFIVDDRPAIERPVDILPGNIERARHIVDKNDLRRLRPGALRKLTVTQQDLDLAANYIAQQFAHGGSRIFLGDGRLRWTASVELPSNPIGKFVNIEGALKAGAGLPQFEHLRLGRLPVPTWMANRLLARVLGEFGITEQVVQRVDISADRIAVTYQWRADLPDKLRTALLPPDEQRRVRAYHDRLLETTRSLPQRTVSLVDLIVPLFTLAEERSRVEDGVAENRALILVLTLYVNGKGLTRIIPAAKDWPSPPLRNVTLDGRSDFSKHFIVSAAVAANAGAPLSDAVGLYKEVEDSRSGSGFSFNDLAADRAGARFGEQAAASAASAIRLQRRVSAGISESDLMPPTKDLPEFLQEAEFKRRFGGVGAPKYETMMAEIDRRVASLLLYR